MKDQLKDEAKLNEESKHQLSAEIKHLREKLDDNILQSQKQQQLEENDLKNVNSIFIFLIYEIVRIFGFFSKFLKFLI